MELQTVYHHRTGRVKVGDPVKVVGSALRGVIERIDDLGKGHVLVTIMCTDDVRRKKPLGGIRASS